MRPHALAALAFAAALGCNASPHSQDQVRRETAAATATVASDVKGAAEGIRDGLHQQVHPADTIDINTAPRTSLEVLPGITPKLATQIIKHRPYAATADLKKRHVVAPEEFDRISTLIRTE